jgi:hypothetical protein
MDARRGAQPVVIYGAAPGLNPEGWAVVGALRRCTSLMQITALRTVRLALHPATTRRGTRSLLK